MNVMFAIWISMGFCLKIHSHLVNNNTYSYATDEQRKQKEMKKKRTYGQFMANFCDSIPDPGNPNIAHVSNEILFILPSFH